jgi:hypothetical protein
LADDGLPLLRNALLVPDVFEDAARRAHRVGGDGAHAPAVARLLAEAEAALAVRPPSVLDKAHVPPSGDKRDYFTLSIYYWPDPAKPDGLPYVPRDGMVNPETREYDRPAFESMARHVDALATAYAVTGDERYAEKAAAFLRTWFVDEPTAMRPNMLFAQHVPGDDVTTPWKDYPARYVPGTGGRKGVYVSFGGTIEDHPLIPLTDAVRLIRPSRHWTGADDAAVVAWYRAYADWLGTHQHGLDEASCRNNHGSWYWAGMACFLEFAGRGDAARRRVEEVLPERLRMQVEPDGSQPEELVRAISQSYVSFTLCSFTNIAVAAARCGADAWSVETPDGRSIRRAVDWFIPYLTGAKPWAWRQAKPFDATATIPSLAACARRFPGEGYEDAIRKAGPLSPDHRYRLLYDVTE